MMKKLIITAVLVFYMSGSLVVSANTQLENDQLLHLHNEMSDYFFYFNASSKTYSVILDENISTFLEQTISENKEDLDVTSEVIDKFLIASKQIYEKVDSGYTLIVKSGNDIGEDFITFYDGEIVENNLSVAEIRSTGFFSNSSTVISSEDVSDEAINSIKNYGDYLDMYGAIIEDYIGNYEEVLKGTIMYDEQAFIEIKENFDTALQEQKSAYKGMDMMPIVGKEHLVEFLVNYRDSLSEFIDAVSEGLNYRLCVEIVGVCSSHS